MRVRAIAISCFLAASAFAEPDLDALATRLGDDDPAVRDAARKELLNLGEEDAPRIEKLLATTKDPEAAASLREIADELRDRPFRDDAKRLAVDAHNGNDVSPELRRLGPKALRVCVYWLAHADTVVGADEDRDWRGWRKDDGKESLAERVAAEARAWASAWTFEPPETDVIRWRILADQVGRGQLEEVRLAALEARGYAVRTPDPGARAAVWSRAAVEFGSAAESAASQAANDIVWQLLSERFDPAASLTSDSAEERMDRLRCWVAANRWAIREEGGRLTSVASREALIEQVSSDDPYARSGAVRLLAAHPDGMPAPGWEVLAHDSQEAYRLVASVRGHPTADSLGPLIEKIGLRWNDPVFAVLWDPAVLAAFAARDGSAPLRARALRILSVRGTASSVEPALAILRDVEKIPEADRQHLCGAAALLLARLGVEADLHLAEPWAFPAAHAVDRRDIAWTLARRGNAAGFRGMLAAIRDEWIEPQEIAALREFVEGTPPNGPGWREWVDREGANYAWDAESKRWRLKK